LYCISFIIRTPVSRKKEQNIKEKSSEKRKKSKREVKEEERGYISVRLLKKSVYIFRFLVIYIPAILYLLSTTNHLNFSTVAFLV